MRITVVCLTAACFQILETTAQQQQQACHLPSCVNGNPQLGKGNVCMCVCDTGYGGPNCDQKDACQAIKNPCLHNGVCKTDEKGQYYCDCNLGFIGPNCEDRDPCMVSPQDHCYNGGTCQRLDDYDFICSCQIPYDGDHCENFNLCHLDPGECLDYRNDLGHIEEMCYPCSFNIQPDGCVMTLNGYYECLCKEGYTGEHCELAQPSMVNMSRITLPVQDLYEMQPHDFIVIAVDVPQDSYVGVAINVSSEFTIHISFRKDFRPDCEDVTDQWETFLPRPPYQDLLKIAPPKDEDQEWDGKYILEATNLSHKVSGRHYVVFWPVWTRGHRYYSWEPEQPVEVTFDYDIFYMDCVTAEELSSGVYHRISIKPEGTCYAVGTETNIKFVQCDCQSLPYFEFYQGITRIQHHPEIYLPVPLFTDLATCWIIPWIVLGCTIAYIILLVICCLCDYWKRKRLYFFVLTDIRKIEQEHFYLLTVQTGNHILAATTANICCEIRGPCSRMKLVLRDQKLADTHLQNYEHNYLFSSKADLGELESVRIWHDNGGDSPDWYVSKMIVTNIKTKAAWYFYLEKWLSVSTYTLICSAEAIPATDVINAQKHSFRKTLKIQFPDKHMALAPIFPLPRSMYTRAERMTVLFVAIFIYMLLLILFYGLYADAGKDPIYLMEWGESDFFHGHVILYGLLAALLAWPIVTLLSWLFRHVWRRRIPTMMVCTKEPPAPIPLVLPPTQDLLQHGDTREMVVAVPQKPKKVSSSDETFEDFRIPSTSVSRTETWIASYVTQKKRKSPDPPVQFVPPQSKQQVCKKVINEGMVGAVVEIKDDDPARLVYKHTKGNIYTERMVAQDICSWYSDPLWPGTDGHAQPDQDDTFGKNQLTNRSTQTIQNELSTAERSELEDLKRRRRHLYVELCQAMAPRGRFGLPRRIVLFLWILCIAIMVACGIFTVIFGIRYGLTRSIEWSFSFVWAVIFAVFGIELAQALIYSFMSHKSWKKKGLTHKEKMAEERFQLIWFVGHCCLPQRWVLKYIILLQSNFFPPLTSYRMFVRRLEEIRKDRLMKNFMDMIVFLIFFLCLNVLAFKIRTVEYFYSKEAIEETFAARKSDAVCNNSFWTAESHDSFYTYLMKAVIENAYGKLEDSAERKIHHEYTLYTPDVLWLSNQVSILVGVIRLRQQRVGPAPCQSDSWIEKSGLKMSCVGNFKNTLLMSTQDKESYGFNWSTSDTIRRMPRKSNFTRHSKSRAGEDGGLLLNDLQGAWQYSSPEKTESIDYIGFLSWYDGGGYVVDLSREKDAAIEALDRLRKSTWIDLRTRVLFIEFTTYNPHVNLFNIHKFAIERSSFRSWNHSTLTITSKFYRPTSFVPVLLIGILVSCCLYFLIRRLLNLAACYKECGLKGVKCGWMWFDILTAIWGLLTCFAIPYVNYLCWTKLEELNGSPYRFVNLQGPTSNLYFVLLACEILLLLALVMFWRLFIPSYRKWFVVGLTLRLTRYTVLGFALYFCTLLVCFACFSHLAFGTMDYQHTTFWRSVINLLQVVKVVDAMSYTALKEYNAVLGPMFYLMYNGIVYFLSINVIISVLTLGLQEAEDSASRRSFKHTYTKIILSHSKQLFIPRRLHKRFRGRDTTEVCDITPLKWSQMKTIVTRRLRRVHATNTDKNLRIKAMKSLADSLTNPHGQRIISKKDIYDNRHARHMKIPPDRIAVMKDTVIQLIRTKTGHDYTAEEQKDYDDYNNQLTRLRQMRLLQVVDRLEGQINAFEESVNVKRSQISYINNSSLSTKKSKVEKLQ